MRAFISIEDIITSKRRLIEFENGLIDVYQEELEKLYQDNEINVCTIYGVHNDIFFLSKEIAQKYLIKIEIDNDEISN